MNSFEFVRFIGSKLTMHLDPLPIPLLLLLPYQRPWHSPIVNHIETRTNLQQLKTIAFSLVRNILILNLKAEKRFGSQQVVYIHCASTSCSHKIKFSQLFIVHTFRLSQTFEISSCMDRHQIVYNV